MASHTNPTRKRGLQTSKVQSPRSKVGGHLGHRLVATWRLVGFDRFLFDLGHLRFAAHAFEHLAVERVDHLPLDRLPEEAWPQLALVARRERDSRLAVADRLDLEPAVLQG